MAQALSKTEQKLLAKRRNSGVICLEGKREVDAAKKLVARGLAVGFEDFSGVSHGRYYINSFTRRACVSRNVFVYSGKLQFSN